VTRDWWVAPEPPQKVATPMLFQDWANVVFVHWPCQPGMLETRIPPGLRLETFDDKAWISLISFQIPRMRAGGLPPLPGIGSGTETHLRTYVEDTEGRRGIWLLSVEFEPVLGAAIARTVFWLPYWWSPHEVEVTSSRIKYRARRGWPKEVSADIAVAPGAMIEGTPLDHFLTARWMLFMRFGPALMASVVEHPRWPLQTADIVRLDETVTPYLGVPPPIDAVAHFSTGVPARIGFPRIVASGRRS
jgi:uncharacterized protein